MTPVPHPARRRSSSRSWLIVVGVASVGAVLAGTVLAIVLTSGSPSGSRQGGQGGSPVSGTTVSGSTVSGQASPVASSGPSASASPSAALVSAAVCTVPADGCAQAGGAQYMTAKPKSITTSGDGSAYVDRLSWTGWGTAQATATGSLHIDDCNPNCAQGKYTAYPATVTVAGLTDYQGSVKAYSTIVVQSPSANTTYTYTKDTVP
jgi:hypothetical protein